MKHTLFILLFVMVYQVAFAQTSNCTRRLQNAEEAFDQGRLLDVIRLIGKDSREALDCFDNFSKDEKIRAEKLLTKVYIFTDNIPEAENALIDLLLEDKEHRLERDDPSELHFLYGQFITEPIFRVGGRFFVNKSLPTVITSFSEKSYNEAGTNSGLGIGFNFELLVERHIKNGFEIAVGPQIRFASYEIEHNILDEEGQLFNNVKNSSTMFRVPILGRYTWYYDEMDEEGNRRSKLPYVILGTSLDLVMNARYVSTDRTGGTPFTLNENNSLTEFEQVATTNVSILIGAGMKFRVGRAKVDFLTFELRYDNSLLNYVNPDNRYKNQDVNYDIGLVEDDLALNTLSFSVGYTRSFYNPKKRKQYR